LNQLLAPDSCFGTSIAIVEATVWRRKRIAEAVKGYTAPAHCFHRLNPKGGSMKRQIASFLGVFGLLLVAACANAQSVNVKANVPFDFVVDNVTLPAGAYSIQSINDASGASTLAIRDENGKVGRLMGSNPAEKLEAAATSHLLFHRYGDTYFLAQIWIQGEQQGRELRQTRRETEMAKNLRPSEDVIVLASLR
jgi:hypothetical protein